MNVLMLTNLYPSDKYPREDTPWTVPYFVREWVKVGHSVVVIVNSTAFPIIYYYGVKLIRRHLIKKYNITGNDLSDSSWAKCFSFDDQGARVYNIPIMKYSPSGRYSSHRIKKQIERIVALLEKLNFKPDLICGHWINPQIMLISMLKEVYKCKTSFVFEGDYWKKYIKRYSIIDYCHGIDKIGCRSETASSQLKESLRLTYYPFICASGVPNEFLLYGRQHNKTFQPSTITVLSAGRLVELKHFDNVIEASSTAFEGLDYSLTIAGEGTLKGYLEWYIYSKHLEKTTALVGKVPRETLMKLMNESLIFVLISDHEAFGIVYIEAMAQGCLVIASKNGGIDGIVVDGVNGFLCKEGSTEDLVKVLKLILSLSSAEREKISMNARMTAAEYSNAKVAYRYLNDAIGIE